MPSLMRGPRVEDNFGLWLTWEVADGPFWRYEQRKMTLLERVVYRLFGRIPSP